MEAVDAVLGRIEALNPRLNAFCFLHADEARAQARAAEAAVLRGDDLGPLHGVPVSVKDNLAIAGKPLDQRLAAAAGQHRARIVADRHAHRRGRRHHRRAHQHARVRLAWLDR